MSLTHCRGEEGGRQRGEKPRRGFGERGALSPGRARSHPTPLATLPPTTGQLISQYKHSSRTGITAPPAARIREAQPGRPGGEADGARCGNNTVIGPGAGAPRGVRNPIGGGVAGRGRLDGRGGRLTLQTESGSGEGGPPRGTPTSLQRGLSSEEDLTQEQAGHSAQGGQQGGPA